MAKALFSAGKVHTWHPRGCGTAVSSIRTYFISAARCTRPCLSLRYLFALRVRYAYADISEIVFSSSKVPGLPVVPEPGLWRVRTLDVLICRTM